MKTDTCTQRRCLRRTDIRSDGLLFQFISQHQTDSSSTQESFLLTKLMVWLLS